MSHRLVVCRLLVAPYRTPTSEIRKRLAVFPLFERYARQIDAALAILNTCRSWLPDECGPGLCISAFEHVDTIYQTVTHYSPSVLAAELRLVSGYDSATDIQAIAAFSLASALRALIELGECLQGTAADEIAALDLYQQYLWGITECLEGAAAWLLPEEYAACEQLTKLAQDAAQTSEFKISGILSGVTRRGKDGSAERDQIILKKALELIAAGTRFHNLSSKLRAWQQRETGKSLSKPAMNDLLRRLGLSLHVDE